MGDIARLPRRLALVLICAGLLGVVPLALPTGPSWAAAPDDPTLLDVVRAEIDLGSDVTSVPFENDPEMVIIDTGGVRASFSLRARTADGWSEWIDVATSDDEAPDGLAGEEGADGATAIGPIWLGDDADEIELVVTAGTVTTVVVEALDSSDDRGPVELVEAPEPDRSDGRTASAIAPRPAIQPRSSWAIAGWADENDGCEGGPFLATNVQGVVVHHTVTSNSYSASQVDDLLRGIYRHHVVVNGWCDIAYNFVVDRFGTIWEARTGSASEPVIGGHTKGFNTATVGIALLGQHQGGSRPTAVAPSSASLASVRSLAGWKLSIHGIDPEGTTWLKNRSSRPPMKFGSDEWVEVPVIVGHRDLGVTSCPGTLTVGSIAPMRSALAPAHNTTPPSVAPDRRPAPFGPGFVTLTAAGGLRPAGAAPGIWGSATSGPAVAIDGIDGRGQALAADGTLAPFGGAPAVSGAPAGARTVVDVAVGSSPGIGWVLADTGHIHRFGGAVDVSAATKPAAGEAVAFDLDRRGDGYVVDRSGRLYPVADAPDATSVSLGASVAVDIAMLPTSRSGWVLDSGGRLHPFGGAPDWQPEQPVAQPRAVLVDGWYGGWVVDAEGSITRFGGERRIFPQSTTTGHPDVVDAALVAWTEGTDDDDYRYADALVDLFLGGEGSSRVVDRNAFLIDEFSSGFVVENLARSESWAGRIVDELYDDVLGRPPDGPGRRYWVDQLANGLRTQDLGALFYGSPEYVADSGSTEAYIRRLYRELLDRTPDAAGLDFWVAALDGGHLTPPEITVGFYQSVESRGRRVEGLYDTILLRPPDPAGLEFWRGELLAVDDIRLAIELALSEEYYTRVTAG